MFYSSLVMNIWNLSIYKYPDSNDTENVKNRIEMYKKMFTIYETIYENGDYGFDNCRLRQFYGDLAKNYMIINEYENAIDCLEQSAEYAIAFDTLPEIFKHTSIISAGYTFEKSKDFNKNFDYNESYIVLYDDMAAKHFEPIKDNERFKAIAAMLKKYAKKEI